MNKHCPDPEHVQDWFCPTCDEHDRNRALSPSDPPESLYDADDGGWIDLDVGDQ